MSGLLTAHSMSFRTIGTVLPREDDTIPVYVSRSLGASAKRKPDGRGSESVIHATAIPPARLVVIDAIQHINPCANRTSYDRGAESSIHIGNYEWSFDGHPDRWAISVPARPPNRRDASDLCTPPATRGCTRLY